MATPDQVRSALTVVTGAAIADTRAVAAAAEATGSPSEVRAALFAAAPLIVGDYIDGSAALALDWYEELRDAARPRRVFRPTPLTVVSDDGLAASVAKATSALYDVEREIDRMTEELLAQATRDSLALLEPVIQKDVAAGYWDTIVGNANVDPEAVGWQRFARPGACKFCLMLADKGAVYSESTANFAAHTSCHCVAGPSFDPDAPRASAMQYLASAKRSPDDRVQMRRNALVRAYLNENYPDAPG